MLKSLTDAKNISITIWTYLADHPVIRLKKHLPDELLVLVQNFRGYCPLCEVFRAYDCKFCPLFLDGCSCVHSSHLYSIWENVNTSIQTRKQTADRILSLLIDWDIEATYRNLPARLRDNFTM